MEVDSISNTDEWQTWPGYLILGVRILIMAWFLFELRETILLERSLETRKFYLHFGAGFLVWFVYLPLVAAVCTQVSALWKYKTMLSKPKMLEFKLSAVPFEKYRTQVRLLKIPSKGGIL